MKFKLLVTTAAMFLSSLPPTIQAAPINDECITLPHPDRQECTNDPLLTQSYEMDYMNFSYAWDKSYGTARVGIVDTPMTIETTGKADFSKLIRTHDSGQYGCYGNSAPYSHHNRFDYCFGNNSHNYNWFFPGINYYAASSNNHGDLIFSLFASTANDNIGMSSICRECSLSIYGSRAIVTNYLSPQLNPKEPDRSDFYEYALFHNKVNKNHYNAMRNAVFSGNQIINKSGFFAGSIGGKAPNYIFQGSSYDDCAYQETRGFEQSLCSTLKGAKELDVIIVASNGNDKGVPNWPAKETDYVIGVGGTDINGNIWEVEPCNYTNNFECGSNYSSIHSIMAPAKNVTVYHNNGNFNTANGCFDIDEEGYQTCSGTSFSAPIIAGVVAIMRSLNPLLSFDEVKNLLSTSRVTTDSQGRTYSIPNIQPIVKKKVLGISNNTEVKNRLKPMFRLHHTYNYQGDDQVAYLSTSIPQVAAAAWRRQYLSEVNNSDGYLKSGELYRTDNNEPLAIGYPRFRQPDMDIYGDNARAPFYIFGGHENPFTGADDMIPLYHFALKTVDTNDPRCFDQADHAYGTFHLSAFSQFINVRCNYGADTRYVKEGIEGYLLAYCPEGTNGCYENTGNAQGPQCLMLRSSDVDNSYALLMESELNKSKFSTYTGTADHLAFMDDAECLGYVYPNVDSDDDLVLDGMEIILGTDPLDSDSDDDGVADGIEYPPTSPVVSDPLVDNS